MSNKTSPEIFQFEGTLERLGSEPKKHKFIAAIAWAQPGSGSLTFYAQGNGDNPGGQMGFGIYLKLSSETRPDGIYRIPGSGSPAITVANIFEEISEREFNAIVGELSLKTNLIDDKINYSGHLKFETETPAFTDHRYRLDVQFDIPKV